MGLKSSKTTAFVAPIIHYPADLANRVHCYLQSGVGLTYAEKHDLPSLEAITRLIDALFYLSLDTEEGDNAICSVAFCSSVNRPENKSRLLRSNADVTRSHVIQFPQPLPCDTRTLRKLAQGVDPSYAALAVRANGSQLQIFGIVDVLPFRFERFAKWETTGSAFVPGLFYAKITGVGEITVYIRDRVVAVLRQSRLILREYDALWRGPVSTLMSRHVRRFLGKIKKEVGNRLYRSAGAWFEATDEVWRCKEDFGPELRDEWLGTLCRVLIRIREYRHGGALILCPGKPTRDLNIKYEVKYHGISQALEEYSAAFISQQYIETEARQGRLQSVQFDAKAISETGYFITPDDRENIFMQGETLPTHEVLFRSWHYLALRSNSLTALAGATGLVASMSRLDGAVLLENGLDVSGFGVEIQTKGDLKDVYEAQNEEATKLTCTDPHAYGTRHRSMMRYCQAHPSAVGIVISQDGDIRAMTTVNSRLVIWNQLQLKPGTLDEDMFPPRVREHLMKLEMQSKQGR